MSVLWFDAFQTISFFQRWFTKRAKLLQKNARPSHYPKGSTVSKTALYFLEELFISFLFQMNSANTYATIFIITFCDLKLLTWNEFTYLQKNRGMDRQKDRETWRLNCQFDTDIGKIVHYQLSNRAWTSLWNGQPSV